MSTQVEIKPVINKAIEMKHGNRMSSHVKLK